MLQRFTKKYMVEDYNRLYDHASLLDLYLFDTQTYAEPDAVEQYATHRNGELLSDVRVQLWCAKSASGGYIVIMGTIPNIWELDEAIRIFSPRTDVHSLGIRVCLERLRVKRNKLYEQSIGRPLMDDERVSA